MKRILLLFNLVISFCIANAFAESKDEQELTLLFKPVFNTKPLVLTTEKYITSQNDTVQITQLRYYLSGFELEYANGTIYKIKDFYQLLDAGNESSQKITFKKIPAGAIVAVKFNIGVDSNKSVSGAHGGDLDPSHGMYWTWNSGYINAKLEGKSNSCATHQHVFEFHVGGYGYPNNSLRQVKINLDTVALIKGSAVVTLQADIAVWFSGIDLKLTNGIMIPGKQAMHMADKYTKMFSVESIR